MAENYVVKEQLTADMIEAGAELTKALDDAGLPVAAAFWLFDPRRSTNGGSCFPHRKLQRMGGGRFTARFMTLSTGWRAKSQPSTGPRSASMIPTLNSYKL